MSLKEMTDTLQRDFDDLERKLDAQIAADVECMQEAARKLKEANDLILRPVPCNPATYRAINTGMSCQIIEG